MKPIEKLDALSEWRNDNSLADALTKHRLGQEFDNAKDAIVANRAQITKFAALVHVAELGGSLNQATLKNRLTKIRHAARLPATKSSTPEELREWRKFTWKEALNAMVELGNDYAQSWNERCRHAFAKHVELGRVLQKLTATKKLGLKMEKTGQEGLLLGSTLPLDKTGFEALKRGRMQAQKELGELSGAGASEEVCQFLIKAVDGTCTLQDLSDEVNSWLRDSKALSDFKVKLPG